MNEQTLAQLLEETRTGNQLLKKQLRFTRMAALALAVLVLVLAVFCVSALREVRTAQEMVAGMRLDQVARQVADVFEKLDVDGLNQAVNGLREQVAALDAEALNETMKALEDAAGSINEAAERFNRMTSFFR